ncbi:MAG: type III-A CRISPR-associated RAMP protein Csm5 [Actinomycetes bacterium]|jgi:CRISPR type III-A-associated RAMP protein Csm5|nr:type III-A CRISPR-associated RAMP protein Csm5 [Actinomycetes bacterium]
MSVKHYTATLTTIGPVHIGTGSQYEKKDYFQKDDMIHILDPAQFFAGLSKEQSLGYIQFLERPSRDGLQGFLSENSLYDLALKCTAYRIASPLTRNRGGKERFDAVFEFVKDAYGKPYVPGSSIKGMLRTAILSAVVSGNNKPFQALFDEAAARDRGRQKTAGKPIERKVFWREIPDPDNPDIVNDVMRYLSVSDSDPLDTGDLVFVKKYDKFARGDKADHKAKMGNLATFEGNELNIYRESLKPGTKIRFTLDIDDRINAYIKLDGCALSLILKQFNDLYRACFLDSFDEAPARGTGSAGTNDNRCQYVAQAGPAKGMRCPNRAIGDTGYCKTHQDKTGAGDTSVASSAAVTCYLGGGVDFDSKTILNALFKDDPSRLDVISRILYSQFPSKVSETKPELAELRNDIMRVGFTPLPFSQVGRQAKEDHRHWKDGELGVSPHTLKMGKIGSNYYPMGKCELKLEERSL